MSGEFDTVCSKKCPHRWSNEVCGTNRLTCIYGAATWLFMGASRSVWLKNTCFMFLPWPFSLSDNKPLHLTPKPFTHRPKDLQIHQIEYRIYDISYTDSYTDISCADRSDISFISFADRSSRSSTVDPLYYRCGMLCENRRIRMPQSKHVRNPTINTDHTDPALQTWC